MASTKLNKLLFTAALAGAGILTRKALNKGWQKQTGRPAPNFQGMAKGDWREIVLWTAVSGAVVGLARLAAHEGIRRTLDDGIAEAGEDVEEASEAIDV